MYYLTRMILSLEKINSGLIACARDKTDYYYLFFILVKTGVRIMEVIQLMPWHFDFEAKNMTVYHGKRNKKRTIVLGDDTTTELEKWIKDKPKNMLLFPITTRTVERLSLRFFGIAPHNFRRMYAVNIYRASDKDIITVRDLLGHNP